MSVSFSRTLPAALATVVLVASTALVAGAPASASDQASQVTPAKASPTVKGAKTDPILFFAADGLRQDLVQQYANQGVMPAMRRLLRNGASATGGGLLTQAPPNTGAATNKRQLLVPRSRAA